MFIEDSGRVVGHVLQNDIGGINLLSAERNSTAVRLSLRWPRTPARRLRSPPGRDTLTRFSHQFVGTGFEDTENLNGGPAGMVAESKMRLWTTACDHGPVFGPSAS